MKHCKIILIVIFLQCTALSQHYKKVKVYLDNQHNIENMINSGITLDHFKIEKDNSIIIFVTEEEYLKLNQLAFRSEILIDDWYKYYEGLQAEKSNKLQFEVNKIKDADGVAGFHLGSMGGYLTLDEIYAELDTLQKNYPSLITVKQSLGNSIEGRPIYMIKISDNPNIDENEPEILYTALHHAREPMSMMQMFYFIYYLLENYDSDAAVKYLIDNRELYFIPVVNPDGYEYNRSIYPNGGGMWRKNRRNNGGSFGVDLNRNYGPLSYWNAPNGGSSTSPSSETYRGAAPFSEPETQIVKNFLASRNIKAALNYHTYSNLLIYPYGALSQETPDSLIFREYASDMTKFNEYNFGTDMQTVGYTTRGNSDDYFYDGDTISNSGKIFAMTPEVGTSSDNFWPLQDRILPLAQENLYPNLYYSWVVGGFATLLNPNFTKDYYIPGEQVQLYPIIKNKGLSEASSVHVELQSLDSHVSIDKGSSDLGTIEARTELTLPEPLTFTISSDSPLESKLNLLFTTSVDGVVTSIDTFGVYAGLPQYIFSDNSGNILENWLVASTPAIPFWEATSEDYHTFPSSYTDSKLGNYANNAVVTMTLNNSVDLSEFVNPILMFWTKYDIESNWDYGQVEISTDNGNSWTPLKGNYTNNGIGSFQPANQPLYDGVQLSWVKEEISLSNYTSNEVKIRFKLISDNYEQRDGWYIDDVAIVAYSAVPVELISFSASSQNSLVILNWQTADELNNYGFEIEKKNLLQAENNSDWIKIGFVPGKGSSNSPQSYSFTDNSVSEFGKYFYRLKQIDFDGSFKYTKEVEVNVNAVSYSLEQNYPNPFNPSTTIRFTLPEKKFVTVKIFDVLGNEIYQLINKELPAGTNEVKFSADGLYQTLASGIYYYQLNAGNYIQTKKMLLMK